MLDAAAWALALEREREAVLAAIRDPTRSPYAAVARADFKGEAPLVFGSDEGCDVRLASASPRHLRIRVQGDRFAVEAIDEGATFRIAGDDSAAMRAATVEAGARLSVAAYTLRLSHQNFPGVVVLDPRSPRVADGPAPRWFAPDPAFRVPARLVRAKEAREEIVLSTRGNPRRAIRLGMLEFSLSGRSLRLSALRLLEPGVGEAALSVFFRDATTGHESYPVGRYLEPEHVPGDEDAYILDFNRAYNPTCAFSPLYNCPLPPRENLLPVAIRAGEQDPGGHD